MRWRQMTLTKFFNMTFPPEELRQKLWDYFLPISADMAVEEKRAQIARRAALERVIKELESTRDDSSHAFNTDEKRRAVKARFYKLLLQLQDEGQVYDLEVVCDETNNPPEFVDGFGFGLNIRIMMTKPGDLFEITCT